MKQCKWWFPVAALACIPFQGGCARDARDAVDPSSTGSNMVVIDTPSRQFEIGDSAQMTARLRNGAGREVSGGRVSWSSSDPSIGEITRSGLFVAHDVGNVRITAIIDGTPGYVDCTISPMKSASIEVVSGGSQYGNAGTILATPVVVRVVNKRGLPLPGISVQWAPLGTASGALASAVTETDAAGQTRNTWRLGTEPGTQSIRVGAGAVSMTVTAEATNHNGTHELVVLFDRPLTGLPTNAIHAGSHVTQLDSEWGGRVSIQGECPRSHYR